MSKHIDKNIKEKIVEFYKSKPMTITNVAKKFGYCNPTIMKILDEYHIKRYNKVQLYSPNLNENYFHNIDTEYKAYFLGLILTDGCIYNTKGRQSLVSLTLQNQDKYLLECFVKEIKSNKKITSDNRGCSEINILSNNMVDDLKRYGLHERKSLDIMFPNNIKNELYPHLIRGILDGDGSVSYYAKPNRRTHSKAIRFCKGNSKFLEDMVDYLYDNIGIDKVNIYHEKDKYQTYKNTWSIRYSKKESMKKLIEYIYDDAHIYMKRKKHLCDLIYNEINKYDGNTEVTISSKAV